MILVLLLLEIAEHVIASRYGMRAHQIFDTAMYVVLLPFGVWLLLTLLENSETERVQTMRDSDLQNELSQQLGSAHSWEELVQHVAAYPHRVIPQASVTLYVYNAHNLRMQAEASCGCDGQMLLKPRLPDRSGDFPAESLALGRYDLPLTRNNQQIGLLQLEYPTTSAPSPEGIHALTRAVPLIALALEGGMLQSLAAEQAAATEAERHEIAQNLHDTLAQNISYLRLKLDQLTGVNTIREISAVLNELERMRSTADEAYRQVRNTLDELGPTHAEDVVTIVIKQARTISERAEFSLRSTQSGSPFMLPALTRQQILYIAREALHNVEKHAQASQVLVQFTWLEAELILKITDNGIGFDPETIPQDGHYGLWIMHQRAQDIGGTLKISPSDGQGTEVTLWIPRPANGSK